MLTSAPVEVKSVRANKSSVSVCFLPDDDPSDRIKTSSWNTADVAGSHSLRQTAERWGRGGWNVTESRKSGKRRRRDDGWMLSQLTGGEGKVTWKTWKPTAFISKPRLSTSYLHSLHRNAPPALSPLHGRLFKFKSIGTLPLTDCKRRFMPGPAAALQSVIVIQPEERVVVAARSAWTSVCQRRPAFINLHRFVLKDPPGDAGHCRTAHTVEFKDQQQESFHPLSLS